MTPYEMIRERLIATPEVTAIAAERIFSDIAPQGAEYPLVVFTCEDGEGFDCLDGSPTGFFQDMVALESFGKNRLEALELWKQCSRALIGYRATNAVTVLESINHANGISWGVFTLDDASDEVIYSCSQVLQINYSIKGF